MSVNAYIIYFSNLKYVLRTHHFDNDVIHRLSHAFLKHLHRADSLNPQDCFLSFCLQSPPNKQSPLAEVIGWHKAAAYCYSVMHHQTIQVTKSIKSQRPPVSHLLEDFRCEVKECSVKPPTHCKRNLDPVSRYAPKREVDLINFVPSKQCAVKKLNVDSVKTAPPVSSVQQQSSQPVMDITAAVSSRRRSLTPGERELIANLQDDPNQFPPERKPVQPKSITTTSSTDVKSKRKHVPSSDSSTVSSVCVPKKVSSVDKASKAKLLLNNFKEQLAEVVIFSKNTHPWYLPRHDLVKKHGKVFSKQDLAWYDQYHVYPAAWKEFTGKSPPDVDQLYSDSLLNIESDLLAYGHVSAEDRPRRGRSRKIK